MLTIPNIEDNPTFDGQAVPDSVDWAAMSGGKQGQGVINGCGVTQHTGSDMNVAVAAGWVSISGIPLVVAAVASLAISAASATDRRDIVVVSNAAVVSVVAGTPCGTAGWTRTSSGLPPVKPAIPANSVLLGEVYVASTTTAITTAANVVDKTAIVNLPGTALWLPTGVVGETVENLRTAAIGATDHVYTDNRPICGGIVLRKGVTITKVQLLLGNTGFTPGSNADGFSWGAITDKGDGTGVNKLVLAVSTNKNAAETANTFATFTLGTPYTPTKDDIGYAVFLFAKGTGGAPVTPTISALTGVLSQTADVIRNPNRWHFGGSGFGGPPAVGAGVGTISTIGYAVLGEALNT